MQPYTFPLAQGPGSTFTSTTTLTDIGNLSVNLAAGGKYLVKAWIQFVVPSGTTTTVGFSLGGTATEVAPTAFSTTIRNNNTTDGANLSASAAIPSVPQTSGALTAATFVAIIDGLVAVSAAGTLTVQAKHFATPAFTIAANAAAMLVQQVG